MLIGARQSYDAYHPTPAPTPAPAPAPVLVGPRQSYDAYHPATAAPAPARAARASGSGETGRGSGGGSAVAQIASVTESPAGTQYQQEVDILRGRIDTLNAAGVWTDANPPKFAGTYGRVLQALEAGVTLRNSFGLLHDAAVNGKSASARILTLVSTHQTQRFTKGHKH